MFDSADFMIMMRLHSRSYCDPARRMFFNNDTNTAMTVFIAGAIAS